MRINGIQILLIALIACFFLEVNINICTHHKLKQSIQCCSFDFEIACFVFKMMQQKMAYVVEPKTSSSSERAYLVQHQHLKFFRKILFPPVSNNYIINNSFFLHIFIIGCSNILHVYDTYYSIVIHVDTVVDSRYSDRKHEGYYFGNCLSDRCWRAISCCTDTSIQECTSTGDCVEEQARIVTSYEYMQVAPIRKCVPL